jgi:integrase
MVHVAGIQRFRDRYGKWRCYHRKTGRPIKAEFGTPEFFLEVQAIEAGLKAKDSTPGTLGALMKVYKASPAFDNLASATRAGYQRYFDVAESLHGLRLTEFDAPFLAQVRDTIGQARGRRTANYVLSVISILFTFGIERGFVKAKVNPAKDVKRLRRDKRRPKANRPWSLEERRTVLQEAPWQIKVPLALAMFTGVRKADALSMTKAALRNGKIDTSKTFEEVFVHVHPRLQAILDAAPRHDAVTIAATSRGRPWTESGFNSVWDRFKDGLEKAGKIGPGLTIHGLRHTVGTLLAEAGTDLDDIRRVLGQKTLTMAQHYSERAKKEAATRGAVHRLDPLGERTGNN